jgi:hypothetical protein
LALLRRHNEPCRILWNRSKNDTFNEQLACKSGSRRAERGTDIIPWNLHDGPDVHWLAISVAVGGVIRTPLTALKIAAFAPMASARTRMVVGATGICRDTQRLVTDPPARPRGSLRFEQPLELFFDVPHDPLAVTERRDERDEGEGETLDEARHGG